ncbi:MAG: histidine triad nucleotide-binding protein [Leptospiraceae bacterium]|nr:histidine triad nucleotide-binding protein [Leptospiraceae bacterium]MCK6381275.1 histidine triad nucleotide-binding protein [Leptospiraceae bacterium]NUM41811.1 histidine triad nucleotide-binding protein [Leptospiraceae bacterium]
MSECIFCKIVEKKITATILYEDELMIAFRDINPVAPDHILFIPKKHIESFGHFTEKEETLIGKFSVRIAKFAKEKGFDKKGYRIVTNIGAEAGQTVFHLHYHLLAGRNFEWPPG